MKEKIKMLIERDNLIEPNRRRDLVHKRAYIYHLLMEDGMRMVEIARIFKRHPSSIHHSVYKFKELLEINDKILLNDINEYDNLLQVSR